MVRSFNLCGAAFALAMFAGSASAHIALMHPSAWGFNVTDKTFPYDNRPVTPLMGLSFEKWWWHNFLDYPPNAGDFFELPAGGTATAQLACDKGATDYYASSQGGDIRAGNWPCPNQPSTQFHTNSQSDVAGCALAITYQSDEHAVQPEDFAVFTTQRNCVWTRYTDFEVPAAMPACPPGGCICSWFWIHEPDSGSEQNYMTPFRCKVTGATQTAPIMKAQVPRRCGADPANGRPNATPSNCTVGAKQPFYWYQAERNNMFEGTYSPPLYNKLYGYEGGAENDIFEASGSSPVTATHSSSPPVAATSTHSVATAATSTHSVATAAVSTHSVATAAISTHSDAAATNQATTNVVVNQKTTSTVTTATAAHTVTTASPAHTDTTVSEAHTTAASSSASVGSGSITKVTKSTGTASSASATSTGRRCKRKRSTLTAGKDAKRAISPHARHHNVGRYIHDSTLH